VWVDHDCPHKVNVLEGGGRRRLDARLEAKDHVGLEFGAALSARVREGGLGKELCKSDEMGKGISVLSGWGARLAIYGHPVIGRRELLVRFLDL